MTDASGAPAAPTHAYEWSVREHARAQHVILKTRLTSEGYWLGVSVFAIAIAGLNGLAFIAHLIPVPVAVTVSVVFVAVFWGIFYGSGWVTAIKQRRTDSSLQYPIHFIFGEHGLRVRGRSAEVAVRWRAMKRVAETRDFILFFYSSSRAYYLPTRVIEPGKLGELRAFLRGHVGEAAELEA